MLTFLRQDLYRFLREELEEQDDDGRLTDRACRVDFALRTVDALILSRTDVLDVWRIDQVPDARVREVITEATGMPVHEVVRVNPDTLPAPTDLWPRQPTLGSLPVVQEIVTAMMLCARAKYAGIAEKVLPKVSGAMHSAIERHFYRRERDWQLSLRGSFDMVPATTSVQYLFAAMAGDQETEDRLYRLLTLFYEAPFLARDPVRPERILLLNEAPIM